MIAGSCSVAIRRRRLWGWLLGVPERPVSESGRLRHGEDAHGRGDRRRRVVMLAIPPPGPATRLPPAETRRSRRRRGPAPGDQEDHPQSAHTPSVAQGPLPVTDGLDPVDTWAHIVEASEVSRRGDDGELGDADGEGQSLPSAEPVRRHPALCAGAPAGARSRAPPKPESAVEAFRPRHRGADHAAGEHA